MTDTVRVPREPTQAMLMAGWSVSAHDIGDDEMSRIWSAMLAASPQGGGSSADAAPIKPSADTGELRERVALIVDPAGFDDRWDVPGLRHETSLDERADDALAKADAILDLIQSERAGSPIGQNDQPGLAFSGEEVKP